MNGLLSPWQFCRSRDDVLDMCEQWRAVMLGALAVTRSMPKSPRDEIGTRETWIQDRLGERKYRQLRMHLSGALRLLNELRDNRARDSAQSSGETTRAVANLTRQLQQLSPKRSLPSRNLKVAKREERKAR